jgi:hypothetical protein
LNLYIKNIRTRITLIRSANADFTDFLQSSDFKIIKIPDCRQASAFICVSQGDLRYLRLKNLFEDLKIYLKVLQ